MNQETPFYYSRSFVIIALCSLGPLALPFLWRSPHFSQFVKWFVTAIITVIVIVLIRILPGLIQKVNENLELIRTAYPELEVFLPH